MATHLASRLQWMIVLLLAVMSCVVSGPAKRGPQCLRAGDLCVPMVRRVGIFGSQYISEPYCCNTTCVPLPRPMNGFCSRFIPQLTGPRTSTGAPPSATDVPSDQRYLAHF